MDVFKKDKVTNDDKAIERDDQEILQSMGYKQELDRGLGSFMNFAFGVTEVSVITGISSLYTYALETGGPVVLVWSWLVTFFFTMCAAYSMAEICSAYPSAGSVYHWAGMIVPDEYRAISSYVCGWCNFLGNAAGDASFAYTFALFVAATAKIATGTTLSTGATVGISEAILIVFTILNFFNISHVGWLNNLGVFAQVFTVVIVLIGLLATSSSLNSFEFVFTDYYNDTGFSSTSYVVAIGLLTSLFGFSGYEASAHMAEETKGSRTSAPYGIINTCYTSGVVGFLYILALLFVTNISEAINGTTSLAAVNVFVDVAGKAFGSFLTCLVVVNLFFAGLSSVAVTGRITYALLRDGAFPYSEYWSHVDEYSKAPIRPLLFVFIFDALLLLLPLVSTVAFDSIVGITTFGFDISYGIPILLKIIFAYNTFPETPMALGSLSHVLNILAVLWLFGTSVIMFFPTESPVTTTNMNWTVVVVVGFATVAAIHWWTYAKDNFHGPRKGKRDHGSDDENDHLLRST